MSSYGIAILVAMELYKKWRDPWYEPTNSMLFDVVKSSFSYKDPRSMEGEERQEYFLRSFIKSDRDLYGADSYYRVNNVVQLAQLLCKQLRFTEAEGWYRYALKLVKHNSGEDHRYAEVLIGLATLYKQANNTTAALSHVEQALKIMADSQESSGKALDHLALHAAILESLQRYSDAFASMEKRFKLKLVQSGPASDELYDDARQMLALAKSAHNKEGMERYQKHNELVLSLIIAEQALGQDCPYLARDLSALADFYGRSGQPDFAHSLRQRARALSLMGNFGSNIDYPGIEHDLTFVASWLKQRATGADCTVAFHLEQRLKRIVEKRRSNATSKHLFRGV